MRKKLTHGDDGGSETQDPTNDQSDGRSLIQVRNVNKEFVLKSGTVKVLKDVNFNIKDNDFSIIFGPSGSGKSTLLNVLSELQPPTNGNVLFGLEDLYRLGTDLRTSFRAQNMGIVHQENYWIKSLNVLENVAMPLYLTGYNRKEALDKAKHSLEMVGMSDFANYQPVVLSGGQQQRVSMARALVSDPKIILADEPTGNLDSKTGQIIMDLLIKFNRELKRAIILVTHNIEYLPLSSTQLYILDGKVAQAHKGQKMPKDIMSSLNNQIAELTRMQEAG